MSKVTFINNSTRYLRALEEAIARSAREIGLQAEGNAKIEIENTPRRVQTGNLKNSITYAVDGDLPKVDVWIGTNVEYGIYVHEGTQRMDPNRFLKNAVTKHSADYKKTIEQNLKNG